MKKEDLNPIKFYVTNQWELVAFDGERYYTVKPCEYTTNKSVFLTDGFIFEPIYVED